MLKSTLLAVLAGYGLIVGGFWWFQGNLIHLPMGEPARTPADVGLRFDDVRLETSDGETLHAWWVPAAEGGEHTILFFHGNAGNIGHRLDSLRIFHDLGQNVLIIDYRGYGESTGSPSEVGLYEDARASYRWLTETQSVATEELVVFGRSLGAAVAARLASEHSVAGLIVESGFVSVPELGAELYPFLPVRTLARYHYATIDHLSSVTAPVLVVHSPDDEIIPFRHGQALYEAADEPKTLLEIRGDHNTGFLTSGDRYIDGLRAFLAQLN